MRDYTEGLANERDCQSAPAKGKKKQKKNGVLHLIVIARLAASKRERGGGSLCNARVVTCISELSFQKKKKKKCGNWAGAEWALMDELCGDSSH